MSNKILYTAEYPVLDPSKPVGSREIGVLREEFERDSDYRALGAALRQGNRFQSIVSPYLPGFKVHGPKLSKLVVAIE